MIKKNIVLSALCCIALCNCQNAKSGENKSILNSSIQDTSFEIQNYLRLSQIYSGRVFVDGNSQNEVFYRIIEIPSEEHVSLYVEKISIGQEGGNFELRKRYRIDEKKLSLKDGFFRLDSLIFNDSTIVSGYFNNSKFKMDLEKEALVDR